MKDEKGPSNEPTYIVKDTRSAIEMKREEARNERARYQATVAHQRSLAKMELAKLRLQQSARSKAQSHIAVVGPLYLCMLVGGFMVMLGTGAIPEDSISVASALLTLLVTSLMANLRSIISESPDQADKGKLDTGSSDKGKSKA